MTEAEPVTTRLATDADVDAAVDVLRRSITELCFADHRGDPDTLAQWLANKTPERFRHWLAKPTLHTIVAEREGSVCGVGMPHARRTADRHPRARHAGPTARRDRGSGPWLIAKTISATSIPRPGSPSCASRSWTPSKGARIDGPAAASSSSGRSSARACGRGRPRVERRGSSTTTRARSGPSPSTSTSRTSTRPWPKPWRRHAMRLERFAGEASARMRDRYSVELDTWEHMEAELLHQVIRDAGSVRKACKMLAVPRSTLSAWVRRHKDRGTWPE